MNGIAIEVRKYVYPGKPQWHSFYIDLAGHTQPGSKRLPGKVPTYAESSALGHTLPGKQQLAVTVEWKE